MVKLWKGTVETLGDLRDSGMGLFAHCKAQYSGHGAKLDLDMLIERFGEDYIYINDRKIGRACVCGTCGHRGAEIRVIANTRPKGS